MEFLYIFKLKKLTMGMISPVRFSCFLFLRRSLAKPVSFLWYGKLELCSFSLLSCFVYLNTGHGEDLAGNVESEFCLFPVSFHKDGFFPVPGHTSPAALNGQDPRLMFNSESV